MGRCRKCIGCCIEAVRWFPVLLLSVAVVWGYYAYVVQLCFVTVQNTAQRVLYLLFFHIFLVMFLWSYFKTIFAPLHRPPDAYFIPSEVMEELIAAKEDHKLCDAILQRYAEQNQLILRTRTFDGVLRYCDKCQCIKPDRAHHCSICSQCVLKFDHHCPWVNTCVNWHNYKFFLLFLGYGLVFCLYVFFTDLPCFINFWRQFGGAFRAGQFHLIFMIFISGMFAISLSCLFFYHLYLTARNRSTVESFRSPILEGGQSDKNAFNHGMRANYREIFGTDPKLWFLPIYSSYGSGSVFRIRSDASYHPMACTSDPPASRSSCSHSTTGSPHQQQPNGACCRHQSTRISASEMA